MSAERAAIPSLLAVSAVHHHLIHERLRIRTGIIVDTGEAREIHHFALLLGYGATLIHPYLALDTLHATAQRHPDELDGLSSKEARKRYLKAAGAGVLKVMSKMGISTVDSYRGAQIFEAIGLSRELVDQHFCGTPSRLGGVGLEVLEADRRRQHREGYAGVRRLPVGGQYQWRHEGELHLFNPTTIAKLQHATRQGRYQIFREYCDAVDQQNRDRGALRGLFKMIKGGSIPLSEVEPAEAIMTRFCTGAMSYGSISAEAHETLAMAMNAIGGKSNSGEGGEDPARFAPDEDGSLRRSAIKQVASGRFGVTSHYLVNADEIQIKMAQGAKPGEGGQLPGHKVWPWIAKVRHSTPGVGLISPPPHHDIYSIEDLAQLIFDLKNANREARINVKLVSEVGVGTVAAGVAKAKADVILISGHDGGTGASPLTSLKYAGGPWELGLAEAQQVLVQNRLRDRVVLQVDGQMKTGRDVVIGALLGAEEFGFATAPLVVMGCIMMRVCQLDTCPVGIATQRPELRALFRGRVEHVINFFRFIAEDVREWMARLGFRTMNEMIGQSDLLRIDIDPHDDKLQGLDLTPILHRGDRSVPTRAMIPQKHGIDDVLDRELIDLARPALIGEGKVRCTLSIKNTDRCVGAMLGSEVSRRYGAQGLPDGSIVLDFAGHAGQSFGAFLPQGIEMSLRGAANDYVGKGLSGGRLTIVVPSDWADDDEGHVIAGNVALYGATSGQLFVAGTVGERFAVRNSGAEAVVEGAGDHACEYMTGGRVVYLGSVGRNFGAGMSGGVAYVLRAQQEQGSSLAAEALAAKGLFLGAVDDPMMPAHCKGCSKPMPSALAAHLPEACSTTAIQCYGSIR